MKKKIVIFFGANYPEGGGVQRVRDMFKYIQEYEKHLISPGRKKINSDEIFERIFIVGKHLPGLSIRSILINLNFMIRALFCFLKNHRKHNYKAIYVTSPPFFPVLVATICKKISKVPIIVDVRDPWALGLVLQQVFTSDSAYCKILCRLEKFGYNASDRVAVVTDGLGKILEREYEVPKKKITIIPNAADIALFRPQLKPAKISGIPKKGIILMYQGSFAVYHNMPELIKVFFQFLENSKKRDVFLVLVGKSSRAELRHITERYEPLKNHLIIVDEVPREQIPHHISAAHIGIVPIKRSAYAQYAIPLKLYEYAACGKPILLFGGTQESENLIKRYEIGTISTENAEAFQAALENLLKKYDFFSKNAIKMSNEINRENSAKLLEGLIDELINRPSGAEGIKCPKYHA